MKGVARWAVSIYLIVFPGAALSQAAGVENFYANIGSFIGEFGTDSPARVIQFAAHQWTAVAGAGKAFEYLGATGYAGCQLGNPKHIYGQAGCAEPACSTLATYYNCPFGGWRIRVWLGSAIFSLNPTASNQMDFQHIVMHELGHRATWHHYDTEIGVMNTVTSRGENYRRFFSHEDVNTFEQSSHFDNAQPPMSYFRSTTWPNPVGGSWTRTDTGVWSGAGFMDFYRGLTYNNPTDRLFVTDTTAPMFSNSYPTSGWRSIGQSSLMRPTVAFDRTRNRWWLFWRPDTTASSVNYSTTIDPAFSVWTTVGTISPNGADPIRTRVPVGATYDFYTDRIIVVFARWTAAGLDSGGLSVVSIPASEYSSGTWGAQINPAGQSTPGPPVIACENTAAAQNCQVVHMGTDAQRRIWEFGIGFNTTGSIYSLGASTTSGATTDFPIGLDYRGDTNGGYWVNTHLGLDRRIYIRSKITAGAYWSSWQAVSSSTVGFTGTPIRIRESSHNYDIFFTP